MWECADEALETGGEHQLLTMEKFLLKNQEKQDPAKGWK